MSLAVRLSDLVTRVATEFKAIRTLISGSPTGGVGSLTTSATNLVAAINEVKTTADNNAASLGTLTTTAVAEGSNLYFTNTRADARVLAAIDDAGAVSVSKLWSSDKTKSYTDVAVAALIATAPTTLDTLNELATALGNDANFASNITTLIGAKANSADVYTQAQIGNPEQDLVAVFNSALL